MVFVSSRWGSLKTIKTMINSKKKEPEVAIESLWEERI